MSQSTGSENPSIAPRLHAIFQKLRGREEARVKLQSYSAASYKPGSGSVGEEIADIFGEIQSEQITLLRLLLELIDDVERALRESGGSVRPLDLMRHFKPFHIATRMQDHNGPSHYVVVSRLSDTGIPDPIEDVISTLIIDGRAWRTFDVALDLLQYWELLLRHQTNLECWDFSQCTRRTLLGRVTGTVFRDGITRGLEALVPPAPNVASAKSANVLLVDLNQRLERISLHLTETDSRRANLNDFTKRDCDPSAAPTKYQNLQQSERLYHDELSYVLSELVHLHDNVKKWFKVHRRSQHELSIVENLLPYRVASCYINTLKHGIRGRNKASALADIKPIIFTQVGDAPTLDDRILDIALVINYEGEAYQASEIIDDLVQVWELFLRNHTVVDTTPYRVELGKRLMARRDLSTYCADLPHGIRSHLKQLSDERLTLDI